MVTDETGLLDKSTLGPLSARDRRVREADTAPALTIAHHTDSARVGERALLLPTQRGPCSFELSRSRPEFSRPSGGPFRPLADRHVSRRPLNLQHDAGAVILDAGRETRGVRVDGAPLSGSRRIEPAALERGVVIELGAPVVLLLHRALVSPERHPALGLVGDGDRMHEVRRQILRVAPLGIPVLLRGESGTGKELVARAIHATGPRANGPFVAVNMGAIPSSMAAASLFGHVRGAFTGAVEASPGYFGRADGGTIFLDEIGEAPLDVQAALLRVLESAEIQPVGEHRPSRVDVRVVAATDLDLERAAHQGRFRFPLHERLRAFEIGLPPLRSRREDIGPLLIHLLREALTELSAPARLERPQERPWLPAWLTVAALVHDWPGNVRELRNLARRLAVVAGDQPEVRPEHLETTPLGKTATRVLASVPPPSLPCEADGGGRRRLADISDAEVRSALEKHGHRPAEAAAALGIAKSSLYALIKRSTTVRQAGDLAAAEIVEALSCCHGDLGEAAASLRVSPRGLRLRMGVLDLMGASVGRETPDPE